MDIFKALALEYTVFLDSFKEPGVGEMVRLHALLARLQAEVLTLGIEASDEDADSVDVMTVTEFGTLHSGLVEKLKTLPVSHYSIVFNPLGTDRAITGWLQDDLADIYLDLNKGLRLLDAARPEEAMWAWRWGYFNHWGRHLVNAQSVLREYLESEGAAFLS